MPSLPLFFFNVDLSLPHIRRAGLLWPHSSKAKARRNMRKENEHESKAK